MTAPAVDAVTVAPQPDLGRRVVRKLFWRLLPFLFLLYIVNYLDRINVGFAKLQMQDQLEFSERVFGIGFSTYSGTVTAARDWGGLAERRCVCVRA